MTSQLLAVDHYSSSSSHTWVRSISTVNSLFYSSHGAFGSLTEPRLIHIRLKNMDSRDRLFGQKSHLILFCVIPGLLLNFSVSLLPYLEKWDNSTFPCSLTELD